MSINNDIEWTSIISKKLPTISDAVLDIFKHATQPESQKMNNIIHEYSKALINVWQKAFGLNHVCSATNVKYHLKKYVKSYHREVYVKIHRNVTKKKNEGEEKCAPAAKESSRKLNNKWKKSNNILFDIGKNMTEFDDDSDEMKFYELQKTSREGRIADEIDTEYEEEQTRQVEQACEVRMQEEAEEQFIMQLQDDIDNNEEVMNSTINDIDLSLNVSNNRSGMIRLKPNGVDVGIQTETTMSDRPSLRINKWISTENIKNACALASTSFGVSAEISRRMVKVIAKELYGHNFYLTPEEQAEGEGIEMTAEQKSNPSIRDRMYVIPSARTITEHKQLLASETETEAAIALLEKSSDVKAIVHFDKMSRNNIDGDWPTIILRFSNGEEFRLRPLFFAYEDRAQITSLFSETFNRLAVAVSIRQAVTIEAKTLWEKIDALMTDSVTKNLGIEDTIPLALGSDHHPLHLLCKSHTVEAIDKSNLEVLARIEKSVNQQQIFESINPGLKSFFRGKTAVV